MAGAHITKRMLHNANKFAYLVKAYPEKNVPELISLFQLSPVDINTAIWAAVELGLVADMNQQQFMDKVKDGDEDEPNPDYLHSKILELPLVWEFGPEVDDLEDAITYAFEKLGKEEKDLEENYVSSWTQGYLAHDVLVAIKHLLEDNVLHEYEIEDGENAYIFYTSKKNAGKNWGAKQFKTNPLTGESNEEAEPDLPTLEELEK